MHRCADRGWKFCWDWTTAQICSLVLLKHVSPNLDFHKTQGAFLRCVLYGIRTSTLNRGSGLQAVSRIATVLDNKNVNCCGVNSIVHDAVTIRYSILFSLRKTLGAFLRCVLYGISNLIPKTGMRLGALPWIRAVVERRNVHPLADRTICSVMVPKGLGVSYRSRWR